MPSTAIVVVDMLNPYRHADAEQLTSGVAAMIDPLARLTKAARQRDDVQLVYINDNYGDFTATRDDLVRSALDGARPDLVRPLLPVSGCAFVSKVRHSAFYGTALAYLLGRLEVSRLIIAGQVTEQCILYSALDAYVRHLSVRVPPDAVAHIDPDLGAAALEMMRRNMSAELVPAEHCLDRTDP
jgi:nicotinamidase-related amidase